MSPTLIIPIKALHPEMGKSIAIPTAMSALAAGLDVAAAVPEPIILKPFERRLIACGFAMALPPGYECQVRPRSGLALRHGITVLNAPGTIDADYRGEVQVLLINLGQEPYTIQPGERIAQLVIQQVGAVRLDVVLELEAAARGTDGFGSTGRQ